MDQYYKNLAFSLSKNLMSHLLAEARVNQA